MAVACEPRSHLAPYVRRYYGFREETRTATRRREGPGTDVVVLLSFGPEWRIGDATQPDRRPERMTSFVGGLRMTSVVTEHYGRSHGMQVSLTPLGAHALFRISMHELAGSVVRLDCLLGVEAEHLVERLATMRSWPERFAALDRAVADRLMDVPPPTPGVLWAWERLARSHGKTPVGELASDLGWSAKRLIRRFREEIGLTPKSLARLFRFERAAAMLERGDLRSLAAVAVDCGYYDQAHLTNEFRRIAGVTPAAHAASNATFLQDADQSPA